MDWIALYTENMDSTHKTWTPAKPENAASADSAPG